MMKGICLPAILVLLLTTGSLISQEDPATRNPHEINVDSLLEVASAVVDSAGHDYMFVLDDYEITLHSDFTSVRTQHTIRKALSTDGIRNCGASVISYNRSYDSVIVDIARTISPDGSTTNVAEDQILRDISPSHLMSNDLYSDQRQMRINFPKLEVGACTELRYRTIRHTAQVPAFSAEFYFRMAVPSLLGAVTVVYPKEINLLYKCYDLATTPTLTENDGSRVLHMAMSDLKPLKFEPAHLPFRDVSPHIWFTTVPDWTAFGDMLLDTLWEDDQSQNLDACNMEDHDAGNTGDTSSIETLKHLFYSMQENIRYVGLEFGVNNLRPYDPSIICERKYGDCKDQANLLVSLLRSSGIDAYPALVATKGRVYQLDPDFACFALMNHAIVYVPDVDGTAYWLDPTNDRVPLGWIAPWIGGSMALVLDRDGCFTVTIPSVGTVPNDMASRGDVVLDSTGRGQITKSMTFRGLRAVGLKQHLASQTVSEIKESVVSWVRSSMPTARDIECMVVGLNGIDSAFAIECSFASDQYFQRSGNLLLSTPGQRSYTDFDESGGLIERENDLLLGYVQSSQSQVILVLPDGFSIDHIPDDISVQSDWVDFERTYDTTRVGQITSTQRLHVKKRHIPATAYAEYRDIIDRLNAASQEVTILKRD